MISHEDAVELAKQFRTEAMAAVHKALLESQQAERAFMALDEFIRASTEMKPASSVKRPVVTRAAYF